MRLAIDALIVAGLAVAAGGCGGSIAPIGNSDGGASSSGSSSGGTSSSSSGAISSSSSSSGGSTAGGTGEIDIELCTGTSTLCTNGTFEFYAWFRAGSQGNSCAPATTSEGCLFYSSCSASPNDVSAGTLTIAGGSLGTGVGVTPAVGSNDYTYTSTAVTLAPGQTFTVSASGGTVPAFAPQPVIAPALVTLTSPAANAAGDYSISTHKDLAVSWTGGQSGAQMMLEGGFNLGSYFLCQWDASLGQATVPRAVLSGLAGESSGYLTYGQYTSTAFTSGSYSISLLALPFTGATASFE